jgi:hypothetical protein
MDLKIKDLKKISNRFIREYSKKYCYRENLEEFQIWLNSKLMSLIVVERFRASGHQYIILMNR